MATTDSEQDTFLTERRTEILGVPVHRVTMAQVLEWVNRRLALRGEADAIMAVNPEKVMRCRQDAALKATLGKASLLIPDGIGVVVACRLLGRGPIGRVPGSDLMPALCALAAERGYRVYLFGARADVNDRAAQVLAHRYPGLQIVGTTHGYVEEREMPGVIHRINCAEPDLLFVALGSPRQEEWMARYLPTLDVAICMGVGGTFDVLAGTVKRAPVAWQKMHLEWLYRLLSEPTRIGRQTALPRFALQVLRQRLSG